MRHPYEAKTPGEEEIALKKLEKTTSLIIHNGLLTPWFSKLGQVVTKRQYGKVIHTFKMIRYVYKRDKDQVSNSRTNGRLCKKGVNHIRFEYSKLVMCRYKVLELVMKKLLNQTDTAEFVVAFAGIQDAIHLIGEQKKLKKAVPDSFFEGIRIRII
ncbi:hypothetical protein IGI04_037019 [Brassica rapa subsp. trilocularis]|uniref:Uncharacterized protein n=1 Tax=Brassica rapa subsp. trilocularis TaxID=1813537 RepID=A0ABQ7LG53_BRACM|nr:hypothetical protein IGI04_037019 [Brassica rapa subsp. trilocularis]